MAILVLGGVKSGKSRYAARRAEHARRLSGAPITLVATARALDEEMTRRIARHRDDRPAHWQTLELPDDLPASTRALSARGHIVVVDCLTLWLTDLLMQGLDDETIGNCVAQLGRVLEGAETPVILVSNETSLGIIPPDPLSRRFCDLAGQMHQRLAEVCTEVVWVAAGLPLWLKGDEHDHT
ncbi:MAG: bifunctional adenosylcobinamide kinase/adenosylcobinamide-phosphate guanylyltransferase [Gammaproteobacteria bacterium]|nr:MAG: bifunctional adenosylcobinamide kinase/adenosylcobinamide-phosphate guanylyltransferase [Gammaproteobacteria bacterium]